MAHRASSQRISGGSAGHHRVAQRDRRYLLNWAVTPGTLKKYHRHVCDFAKWTIDNHEDPDIDDAEFDELLLDYIHELYESGRGKSSAACTYYGIVHYLPHLRRRLPCSYQAVRGWLKQQPGRSYPPMTWELAAAVAARLAKSGHYAAGVGVLLAFDCFLRVSELVGLRREDVADYGDRRIAVEHKGMIIRIRTAKTGKEQWVRVLDTKVMELVRALVRSTRPGQLLFNFSSASFRRYFKGACADLGLSPLYVPHSLRHGGATRYYEVLRWSVEDILERGRWASTKSARRYIQSGVAMLLSMKAPKAVHALGVRVLSDLPLYLNVARGLATAQF